MRKDCVKLIFRARSQFLPRQRTPSSLLGTSSYARTLRDTSLFPKGTRYLSFYSSTFLRSRWTPPPMARAYSQDATEKEDVYKDYRDYSVSPPLPSPYAVGSRLSISLQSCQGAGPICGEVEVVKAFTPFTVAAVVLVRPVAQCFPELPGLFILKLMDIRFTPQIGIYMAPDRSWTTQTRSDFVEGLRRVRECEWHNEWERHIAGGRPHREGEPRPDDEGQPELTEFDCNMWHYHWAWDFTEDEIKAYRALQHLQGTSIPRFLGPVRLATQDPEPLLATVPGVAIEFIDGVTLEHFKLGQNITAEQAERVSQGTLHIARQMRNAYFLHHDLYFRNIMLRRTEHDAFDFDHPVVIDFGKGQLYKPEDEKDTDYIDHLNATMERTRALFSREDWHVRSLYLAHYQPDPLWGYNTPNSLIEQMSAGIRDRYFEAIPKSERETPRETVDEETGQTCVYEPARWMVRKGVRGSDADREWQPEGFPRSPNLPEINYLRNASRPAVPE